MAHCYYHALSSVRKWGGTSDDYLALHQWFDESKAIFADPRHRALRHHAEGIFMLETLFGATITNSDGKVVPVRLIGEQHVTEDLGFIPSFADWGRLIQPADLDAERAPIGPAGERCTARTRSSGASQPCRISPLCIRAQGVQIKEHSPQFGG